MGNQRHFWNWEAVIRSNHIQLTIQKPAASSLPWNSANKERLSSWYHRKTKKKKKYIFFGQQQCLNCKDLDNRQPGQIQIHRYKYTNTNTQIQRKKKKIYFRSEAMLKLQGPWQASPRANLRGGDCSVIGHETNRSENLFESICRSWLKMWSRNRFRSGSKVVRSLFRIMVGKKFFGSWWEKSCKGIPCSLLNQSETETLPDYQLQKSVENISKFKSSDHVEILFVCLRTKSRNSDYKQ